MRTILIIFSALMMIAGSIAVIQKKDVHIKGINIGGYGGYILILFGMWFFYLGINKISLKGDSAILKCPKCGHLSQKTISIEEQRCQKCNEKLEKLDGFFLRHPEFNKKIRKDL